jgi:hypothetical protein
MTWLKKISSSYLGFAVGTIFGAIVSSITSYYVFSIALGEPDAATIFGIQDCLIERVNE